MYLLIKFIIFQIKLIKTFFNIYQNIANMKQFIYLIIILNQIYLIINQQTENITQEKENNEEHIFNGVYRIDSEKDRHSLIIDDNNLKKEKKIILE